MVLRRTISEVIARHKVARGLRDIYCEGITDNRLIKMILDDRRWNTVDVFSIDDVEIPGHMVATAGFTGGNKQRLLSLAGIFNATGVARHQAAFIIDADCERFCHPMKPHPKNVYRTDFVDGGLYYYDVAALHRVMALHTAHDLAEQNHLISLAETACRTHFAALIVATSNDLHFARPDPKRYIVLQAGSFTFDRDAYLNAWLHPLGATTQQQYKLEVITHLQATVQADVRHCANSHCLFDVLAHVLSRRHRNSAFRDETALRTVMSGAINIPHISRMTLFDSVGRGFFEGMSF